MNLEVVNLEDLRPGMWVTVLDPVAQEITEEDDLSGEGWQDSVDRDRRPNIKHGVKACISSMALSTYSNLTGKPLLVSCIEPPFVFCDVLAMAACELHPVQRAFTVIDSRLVVFMSLSQRYVDAMIDAMLSIARPESDFGKEQRCSPVAAMLGGELPLPKTCPIRDYIKHIESRKDAIRRAHLGI